MCALTFCATVEANDLEQLLAGIDPVAIATGGGIVPGLGDSSMGGVGWVVRGDGQLPQVFVHVARPKLAFRHERFDPVAEHVTVYDR